MSLLGGLTVEKTLFYLPVGVTAGQVLCHRDPSGCCDAAAATGDGAPVPADLFVTVIATGECECLQGTYRLSHAGGTWSSSAETACDVSVEWQVACVDGRLSLTGLIGGVPFLVVDGVPSAPVYLHWSATVADPCGGTIDVYLVE